MGADLSDAFPSSRPYSVGKFAKFHTCLNLLHGHLSPPCMPLAHDCINFPQTASQSSMREFNTRESSKCMVMPVLQRLPLETVRCYAGAPAYKQPACCTICKTLVSYPSCCTIAAIRRKFSGSYGIRETSDSPIFLVCHLSTTALADPVLHAPFDGVVGGPALTIAH